MKKLLILLLCLALALSLTACGGKSGDASAETAEDGGAISTEEPAAPTEEPVSPTEEPAQPSEEPASPTEEPVEPAEEPASPTKEPAEADSAGAVSDGVYTNELFGISFAPPAGWSLMGQEELAELQEASGDMVSQQSEDLGDAYESVLDSGELQYVMAASSQTGTDNVVAIVEHVPGMGGVVDEDMLLDMAISDEGLGNEDLSELGIVTERNTITLAGVERSGIAMTQDGAAYGADVDICQQIVVLLEGDYALQLVLTSTAQENIGQIAGYFSPIQ